MKKTDGMTVREFCDLVSGDGDNFDEGMQTELKEALAVVFAEPTERPRLWLFSEKWTGEAPRYEVYVLREEAIDRFRRTIMSSRRNHPEVDFRRNRRRDDRYYAFDDKVTFRVDGYEIDRRKGRWCDRPE